MSLTILITNTFYISLSVHFCNWMDEWLFHPSLLLKHVCVCMFLIINYLFIFSLCVSSLYTSCNLCANLYVSVTSGISHLLFLVSDITIESTASKAILSYPPSLTSNAMSAWALLLLTSQMSYLSRAGVYIGTRYVAMQASLVSI